MEYDKEKARVIVLKRYRLYRLKKRDYFSSYASYKKWKKKYPSHFKAHKLVYSAIRAGLIKRKPCQICGFHKSEAHHEDYRYPYEIVWLCKSHHAKFDMKRRSLSV